MDHLISTDSLDQQIEGTSVSAASTTLDSECNRKLNAYWRAANYLSVGQLYLYDNPLLREPLTLDHIKPLVVGHWGTTPGQNVRRQNIWRNSWRKLAECGLRLGG